MFTLCFSHRHLVSLHRWQPSTPHPARRRHHRSVRTVRPRGSSPSPLSDGGSSSSPLDYDASGELLGLDVDLHPRKIIPGAAKLRSWFGPNGQYIRELPCPSCRGRGYTPCTECGVERSRSDCAQCSGKGIRTCLQCFGDRVIWEESIDERPWEKARSSSPLKMKEDDEVDKMEIKVNVTRKSKRIYQSPSPEVSLKISRSLRILNAKTGLFSKRMKIIHQDPVLHAQRRAAIKKAKGTDEARKQASESMKAFFSDPENRLKRSVSMKGVKFYCSHCGGEGHRKHYCSKLRETLSELRLKCSSCGERGHNQRTCGKLSSDEEAKRRKPSSESRHCRFCGQVGHNRRTCPEISKYRFIIWHVRVLLHKLLKHGRLQQETERSWRWLVREGLVCQVFLFARYRGFFVFGLEEIFCLLERLKLASVCLCFLGPEPPDVCTQVEVGNCVDPSRLYGCNVISMCSLFLSV